VRFFRRFIGHTKNISHKFYILYTTYIIYGERMAKISLNVDEPTLQSFDKLWQNEGWESRQEAIVFLMRQSVARGFISKEKSEIVKAVGGDKQ